MFYWLLIIFLIFAISFLYAAWRGAPWVPMRKADIERVLALANLSLGQVFVELGSGDGRMSVAAAAKGAKAKGFELSLLPFLLSIARNIFIPANRRPKFYFKDLWKVNLSDADVVYVFLTPPIMPALKEKLEKELKTGARVICYVWAMPGWQPVASDLLAGRCKVYLYKR
jgi:SAM-dependent methyltransferase